MPREWTTNSRIRFSCSVVQLASSITILIAAAGFVWGVATYKATVESRLDKLQESISEIQSFIGMHREK